MRLLTIIPPRVSVVIHRTIHSSGNRTGPSVRWMIRTSCTSKKLPNKRQTNLLLQKGNKWCRSIVMFQVDHIRDVNYFFKTEVAYDFYMGTSFYEGMPLPYKVTIETMNAEYTSFEMVSFSGSVCPMILRIISSSSVQTLFDRHSRRDSSTSSS